MAKYGEWTLGETEALLNVVGGVGVARAVLRGELRITVEVVPQSQIPVHPPLVGRTWKTITVPAYQAKNFAEAVRLGDFDNREMLGNITRLWGKDPVGLDKPVKIDLVEFDREWWYGEAVAWGKEHNKSLMATAHTMGIAVGLPNEQRDRLIVQLNSVRGGGVLFLDGGSRRRDLDRRTVRGDWYRRCLVGFLSE